MGPERSSVHSQGQALGERQADVGFSHEKPFALKQAETLPARACRVPPSRSTLTHVVLAFLPFPGPEMPPLSSHGILLTQRRVAQE